MSVYLFLKSNESRSRTGRRPLDRTPTVGSFVFFHAPIMRGSHYLASKPRQRQESGRAWLVGRRNAERKRAYLRGSEERYMRRKIYVEDGPKKRHLNRKCSGALQLRHMFSAEPQRRRAHEVSSNRYRASESLPIKQKLTRGSPRMNEGAWSLVEDKIKHQIHSCASVAREPTDQSGTVVRLWYMAIAVLISISLISDHSNAQYL